MTSRMASCDVYCYASYFISAVFRTLNLYSMSETMVCNKMLIHVVLWTRLRMSFNACVDPLFDVQVIYWALTRQPTTG
jgi:hypothetical protein